MQIRMCLNLKPTRAKMSFILFPYTIHRVCCKFCVPRVSHLAGHFRCFLGSLDIRSVWAHLHALPFYFSLQISLIVFLKKIKHSMRAPQECEKLWTAVMSFAQQDHGLDSYFSYFYKTRKSFKTRGRNMPWSDLFTSNQKASVY